MKGQGDWRFAQAFAVGSWKDRELQESSHAAQCNLLQARIFSDYSSSDCDILKNFFSWHACNSKQHDPWPDTPSYLTVHK